MALGANKNPVLKPLKLAIVVHTKFSGCVQRRGCFLHNDKCDNHDELLVLMVNPLRVWPWKAQCNVKRLNLHARTWKQSSSRLSKKSLAVLGLWISYKTCFFRQSIPLLLLVMMFIDSWAIQVTRRAKKWSLFCAALGRGHNDKKCVICFNSNDFWHVISNWISRNRISKFRRGKDLVIGNYHFKIRPEMSPQRLIQTIRRFLTWLAWKG